MCRKTTIFIVILFSYEHSVLSCAAKLQLKFKGDIHFSLQLLGFVDHLFKSLRSTPF